MRPADRCSPISTHPLHRLEVTLRNNAVLRTHGRVLCLVVVFCSSAGLHAQSATASSVLSQRYRAAQDFQAAHELDKAAGQYRILLADALGQLARLEGLASAHAQAADEFQEALSLFPDFPALRLEYARLALRDHDLNRAQREASIVVRSTNPQLAAGAHSVLARVLAEQGKGADAKHEWEQAVALDPTFDNGYALAVADLDAGDGEGAAKLFAEMLTSFGDTAQIHMLFGQAYGNSDFQSRAVDEFRAALARDPKLPGAHYSLAAALLTTSGDTKTAEAEAELRKEIALDAPHDPSAGAAYAALGHLLAAESTPSKDEALRDLHRATELAPTNPDAWFYLGQVLADTHQAPSAIDALRRSIALTSDPAHNNYQVRKAHYLLGRLLQQSGQEAEGRKEIALSQSLMQQNLQRDRSRLADYLDEAHPATSTSAPAQPDAPSSPGTTAAAEALRKQLTPILADSYNNLGAIAGSENNYPVALHYFQRAAEWNPALPGIDLNWGRAAFLAGEPAEAVAPLTRARRAQPNDRGITSMLGMAQFLTHDYASARTTLQPLADAPDSAPELRFAYARSLEETGSAADALPRLEALAKLTPDVAPVHAALGELYSKTDPPRATAELETAIRLNPRDPDAHAALARLQLAQGNTQAAVTQFEAAVQLAPADATLRRELDQSRARLARP
jgi:tetratricopeptide (TPR) repeat protein